MYHSLFREWFGEKRYYSLILQKGNCPLTFRERVLYSFLVDRIPKGGTTRRYIRRRLRLDHRALRRLYESLIARRLAKWEGDRLLALEPEQPSWFVWRTKPGLPWYRAILGIPCCPPPKGWTLEQTAVYFCSLAGNVQSGRKLIPSQKKSGIAAMLGVSRHTVRRTYTKLRDLGLLHGDYLREPSGDVLALFAAKTARTTAPSSAWSVCDALGWQLDTGKERPVLKRQVEEAAATMLTRDYTREEIIEYIADVADTAQSVEVMVEFFWGWKTLFQDVEQETSRNRSDGKFKGRNALGLLQQRSEEAIERIQDNRKYMVS